MKQPLPLKAVSRHLPMVGKVVVVVMIIVIRVVAWVAELSLDNRFQVSLIVFIVRIGVVVERP